MAEPYAIKMPQLSDTMTEGVVVSWEKNIGDKIKRGDIVATVETDKAIMDVEVFRDGFLSGPLAAVDSVVPVGGAIGFLVANAKQVKQGEMAKTAASAKTETQSAGKPAASDAGKKTASAAPAPKEKAAPRGDKAATPYARKLAGQLGLDLGDVEGTGPQGEIVSADIERSKGGGGFIEAPVSGDGRAMSSLEKAIAHAMASSVSMPTFTMTAHIHLDALIRAAKAQGVSVTVAIAKACALAMGKHPKMNWCYQPVDRLVERTQVDIGMAVAADDGGLVVPVLRAAESRTPAELNDSWKDLVERARKRRLKPDEYANPTFMVSNMGMFGVSQFDAIPTPGLAGILAISANTERGSPFTITADHRVVNGADVGMYLNTLKSLAENPQDWMVPTGPAVPKGEWDYDVVVIGGGPGGEDCARDLVAHGLKVAMINDSPFPGGECLWRGCIPSKAWRAAADRLRDRANDRHLGITGTTGGKLNWSLLEKTRRKVLETRGDMALKTDKGVRINYIHGYARFVDNHHVEITTSGNRKDPHVRAEPGKSARGKPISFGCAVIATGAPPFVPPIEGAAEGVKRGTVLTSDTVWSLPRVPKRLVVVGAGAIGVEMAQIFQDFGVQVTLLEMQERILAEVESEVATQLAQVMNADPRLDVFTGVKVNRISGKRGAMSVSYSTPDGKSKRANADYVIMATGKRPELDGLQLDKAGVDRDGHAVRIDARCRTSVPHVFAVGDVVGGLMLAHTAAQQGRVAAATIVGEDMKYDQSKDCGVIFTRPQAAFVGLSIEQCKAKGIEAVEIKVPINIDAKAMINNEQHGLIKMVVDKQSQRVVGVHFLADHADTLIGEAVLMVSCGLTLDQVGQAIHAHPTQTELFGDLARRLGARLRRSARVKAK